MMRQKWGRIVNVTTSLGTMIREGSPTYGPSKAALEAFSAIMAKDLAGTGVTVNVLVPGGVTNTGMVPLEAGYDRAEMVQPVVMAPPLNWLVSDAAGGVTGGGAFSRCIGTRACRPKTPRKSRLPHCLDCDRDYADRAAAAALAISGRESCSGPTVIAPAGRYRGRATVLPAYTSSMWAPLPRCERAGNPGDVAAI